MLVVKRLYGFSYEECERFVSDSITLRQFCRLYLQPAPGDTTLIRWANLIGADALEELNEREEVGVERVCLPQLGRESRKSAEDTSTSAGSDVVRGSEPDPREAYQRAQEARSPRQMQRPRRRGFRTMDRLGRPGGEPEHDSSTPGYRTVEPVDIPGCLVTNQ
jgi:hypothetical protein